MNWLQKYGGLLIAIGIAAYAIHGLMGADLVMPYSLGGLVRWTRFIHLRGMWAIGGSICLLPAPQVSPLCLTEIPERETRHKTR